MSGDFFQKYVSGDNTFHIIEDRFVPEKQGAQESVFTLGNGFIGSRGIMEELPAGSMPGTFVAGMYDISAGQVEELINIPNPINFMVSVEGEKFDIRNMKVLSHRRILDMKHGTLVRKTVFRDAKKRKYEYQSMRFFSMDDPHIGCLQVSIKIIKGRAQLATIGRIDDAVYNTGGLMLPRKRHFNTLKADKEGDLDYLLFRTNYYKNLISYADAFIVRYKNSTFANNDRFFQFALEAGQEIVFTKYFSLYTSYNYVEKSIKRETMRTLNEAVSKGLDRLFSEHKKSFAERWKISDIEIKGDRDIQRAMRFNIYHMLIAARKEYARFSIGAKTLSGQGYRGHIFWDTEIFLLPFYAFTQPQTAKELLMFRYATLEQARVIAREKGYEGAMYPWESTVSGTEQTPRYSKDSSGSIIEVRTQDFEHHITADVAFGVRTYYSITGDFDFMLKYGAEIVFETARFWASRVSYSRKDGAYHIRDVIGPDEFHVDVDDNAYTNYLARWNMEYAVKLYGQIKKKDRSSGVIRKIGLTAKEVNNWKDIADRLHLPASAKKNIIKQFEGYLRKKDYVIQEYDNAFMPVLPGNFEFEELGRSSLLKQADVLALFCLFPERFSLEEKLHNYDYYILRTAHKSSLSYCLHAILGNDLGDFFRSFCFFWRALNTDLKDVPGNTVDGIHSANLGGVWQALVFGYGGLKYENDTLRITPKLPGNIKSLKFRFHFMGGLFEVEEKQNQIRVRYLSREQKSGLRGKIRIFIFGKHIDLSPGKSRTVNLEDFWIRTITAGDVVKDRPEITVDENKKVREIGGMLHKHRLTGVPVVDKKKNLKGFISEKNILQSTYKNRFGNLKAKDIMETRVVSVKSGNSIEHVAMILSETPYRKLPVLKGKKVIGLISRSELIDKFLKSRLT